jgi:hypothetical protein
MSDFSRAELTNCIEQRPSWEVDSPLVSQGIPHIFWNLKVHYCVQKSLPVIPILNQMNPVCSITLHPLILHLPLPSSLFPSNFLTQTVYTFLITFMCAACSSHFILLDLINLTISGEYNILWSSSFCIFLHLPIPSTLSWVQIVSSAVFLKNPQFIECLLLYGTMYSGL